MRAFLLLQPLSHNITIASMILTSDSEVASPISNLKEPLQMLMVAAATANDSAFRGILIDYY